MANRFLSRQEKSNEIDPHFVVPAVCSFNFEVTSRKQRNVDPFRCFIQLNSNFHSKLPSYVYLQMMFICSSDQGTVK